MYSNAIPIYTAVDSKSISYSSGCYGYLNVSYGWNVNLLLYIIYHKLYMAKRTTSTSGIRFSYILDVPVNTKFQLSQVFSQDAYNKCVYVGSFVHVFFQNCLIHPTSFTHIIQDVYFLA